MKRSNLYNKIMSHKQYAVYILTNPTNRVFYTGVTNNLVRRIYEHRNKLISGFTSKYNLIKIVYYELFDDINEAISREKQLKAGSRKKKFDLIQSFNRNFEDLYPTLL